MPGGGGNPLVQAISYQMKHYHPGSFPKLGKADRHRLCLSNDPVAGLRRQAYYLKYRSLKAYWLLCESAEVLKGDARRKIEAFLAFVERELGKPGGVPAAFLSMKGFSGGSSAGIFAVLNHGPPAAGKASRILPRLISRLINSTRKALCVGLAGFIACLGLATNASASPKQTAAALRPATVLMETQMPEQRKDLTSIILQEKLNLSTKTNSAYDNYFNAAIQYSEEYAQDKNPETRQKAVNSFKEAIRLDQGRTMQEMQKGNLDSTVKGAYLTAVYENNVDKDKKENKSHLGTYLLIGGGVLAAAAVAYLLLNKKSNPTPPPPVNVTITLDAYNSTKGFQKDLTSKTVTAGSSVDILISDMGVSNVDTKYVAVYSEDFKTKISFDSDGSATFTAPSTNIKYHVILFDTLGVNVYGDQVSYDWVNGASLYNNKRNHIVYPKNYNGQTMPEKVWGGEYISEIKANGVFDQINNALATNYTTWGHVDWQSNGTTGDFSAGAGDSNGADGWHAGSYITVNAKKLNYYMISMLAIGDAEAVENLINTDNVGGKPSNGTIQTQGVLNDDGKRLLLFVYIKDSASFTASSNAMATAMNMINVNQQLGPVDVGIGGGAIHLGVNDKKMGVNTTLRPNGKGLDTYTTANFTGEKFQAGVGMINTPSQQFYNAQATMNFDKVILGLSGGYDAKTKQSNAALNVGANLGKNTNLMLGTAVTPGMLGFNIQATQRLKEIGIIGFRSMYTKNQLADFVALGLDAQLDNTPIGPVRIVGDYSKSGMYKTARLGIGKPIGPGMFSLSLERWTESAAFVDLRYSCSWGF